MEPVSQEELQLRIDLWNSLPAEERARLVEFFKLVAEDVRYSNLFLKNLKFSGGDGPKVEEPRQLAAAIG